MVDNHQILAKTVILTIAGSSREQLSIEVSVRLSHNNTLVDSTVFGKLLPLPQELLDAYEDWKNSYLAWGKTYRYWQRSIDVSTNPIETNVSIQDCDTREEKLIKEFNSWLAVNESPGLSKVAINIIKNVVPSEYKDRPALLSFVVQTKINDSQLDLDLQKFPWNEWEFIKDHYDSSVSLSTKESRVIDQQPHRLKALVICGKYDELKNKIDTKSDIDAIQQNLNGLVDLETWICDSTTSKLELRNKLNNSTYHLLFFCGHSSKNQMQLNDDEYISVNDYKFKEILKKLRNRGLILALFNSCDGLSFAHSFMEVEIPYTIVMKEKVHDLVAQEFIKEFLQQAIRPEIPIHVAVNEARKKLESLQELPHGEFLPVLFQNTFQQPFYLNPPIIPMVDPQPEPPLDKQWWVRWLKSRRVKYLTIAVMSVIATLSLAVYPYSKIIISTWMSPPICKFADDTEHISCGEEIILIKPNGTSSGNKINGFSSVKEGVKNPSTSTYQKAIIDLKKDWQFEHDPETAIAIENASIALKSIDNPGIKIKNIAVVVPAQQNTPYYVADSLLKGVAYAQKQQNSKDDWKLRVLIADDANNKIQSQEIAQKLVDRRDILGVIGHYSSNVTIPIVNNNTYKDKTVLISSTATADELNSKNAEKFFFRLAPSSNFSAEGMVKKWMKPERKIVLFYQSSEGKFSLSLRQAFKEAIMKDGKYSINNIVKEFDLSKSNNVKNEIEQAKKANANSIILFPDAYTGDNKTNNKAEEVMVHNKGEMPILANTSVYDSYEQKYRTPSITVLPELYKNVVMSIPWEYSNRKTRYSPELTLQDDPNQLPAIPKWWLFDGESIDRLNQRIVLSHDAALVLIEAIQRAEDADRGDDNRYIKKIIAGRNFEAQGITGKISFNGGSDRVEQMDSLVTPDCNEKECKGFKIYKSK
jgi:branched-chain amino acid transport system substrate-binding protein